MATVTKKRDRYWRIGPFDAILIIAILAIAAALITPIFLGVGEPPISIRIVSALKQTAVATTIYMSDYDERLPFIEPCEFPVDPLQPYHSKTTMYLNPTMIGPMSGYDRRGSDLIFQFVIERSAFDPKRTSRSILNILGLEHPENSILIWTPYWGKDYISIAFADSHVKSMKPPIRSELLPNLDGFMGARGRLVGPKEKWPPPTWTVPFKDVLAYAEQAKRELADQKPAATDK